MKQVGKTTTMGWRKPLIIILCALGVILALAYSSRFFAANALSAEDLKTYILETTYSIEQAIFFKEDPNEDPKVNPKTKKASFSRTGIIKFDETINIYSKDSLKKIEKKIFDYIEDAYTKTGGKSIFPKEKALEELTNSTKTVMILFNVMEMFNGMKIDDVGRLANVALVDNANICTKIQELITIGNKIKSSWTESKSTRMVTAILALLNAKIYEMMGIITNNPEAPCYNMKDIEALLK